MCLNQIHSLNYVMVKVRWADWCGWLWVRKWWGHWEDLGAFNHKLPGFETFRRHLSRVWSLRSQQLAAATPIKDLLLHNCSISKLSSERYPQGQSNAMTIASSSNHGS